MNNNVPKRRFKGFNDEWETSLIKEAGNVITGTTPSTKVSEYYNGKYLFATPGDISNERYICKTNTTLTKKGLSQGRLIPPHSVLFVCVGSTIGKVALNKTKLISNQQINTIVPFNNVSSSFLYSVMLNNADKVKIQASNQAVPIIPKSQFENIEIKLPSYQEQKQIGDFFQKLDNMIELQSQKINKYKMLKESYLEKMFPEGKKNIPELRFKNFNNTEVWNVKSLKELGYTYNSLSGMTKEDFDNGTSKYITYLNVFHNSITRINELEKVRINKKQNKVLNGDVFFTTSSETPEEVGMSSVWTHDLDDVYLNSFCFGYRFYDKFNPYFTANLFRSNGFRKEIELLAQGISRFNISKQRVMELSISYPSVNEQKTIGNFFSKLDNIIELQNKKLNKLKDLKQAYLNEMFVN